MSQTRIMSFTESLANIIIGYCIVFFANLIFLPMFGFNITISQNFILGGIYTVISLLRSYCIRRWFNKL